MTISRVEMIKTVTKEELLNSTRKTISSANGEEKVLFAFEENGDVNEGITEISEEKAKELAKKYNLIFDEKTVKFIENQKKQPQVPANPPNGKKYGNWFTRLLKSFNRWKK